MPQQANDILTQIWAYVSQLDRSVVIMIINGMVAGWLAGQILGGAGLLRNLVVGIIGAFVGGAMVNYKLLNLPVSITSITDTVPYGTQILVSTIGAMIVILIARFLGRS
jgi:uncharacterized membrane protein YeaQ/YmgE (transglycosylase-associated protein family)